MTSNAPARARPALALVACVAALACLPMLAMPHGRDQGSYAYTGWRLLEGQLPYRDVMAFKPPGTVFVHAASIALFGVNEIAIRALDLGWTVASALAVFGLGRALGASVRGATLAGVALGLLYATLDFWNTAQTDGWTNLPLTLALWGVVAAGRGRGLWLAAGAAVGAAVLLKYTALGVALPIAVAVGFQAREEGIGATRAFGWGALGLGGVLAGALGALWATGSWAGFAEIQFELVPEYVDEQRKGGSLGATLLRSVRFTSHQVDLIPLVLAGPVGVLGAWRALPARGLAVLIAWWLAGAVGVIAQGKYYDYHYVPLLAPGALLLGAGLDAALSAVGSRARLATGALAVAALLGMAFGPWGTYAREAWRASAGREAKVAMWGRVRRYNYRDYDCAEVDAAGRWLAEHTTPEQPVFVWSYDPAILVRAQRRQVSRFLYNYPLRVPWADPAWEHEIVAALVAEPPAAVVIATGDATAGVTGHTRDSTKDLARLPALKAHLDAGWCEVERVGRYRMWLPRGAGC